MSEIKILFLTHPYPNYVPDLLLHGLRKLFGPNVVDFPRKDCVYDGILGLGICPDDQKCPNWFPPDENNIDREDITLKITKGVFIYIICDIRAVSILQSIVSQWPPGLALIDGEDQPVRIPPGPYVICRRETDGTDHSIPLPMALPEEIFHWISSFDENEKKYSIGFLGATGNFNEERKSLVDILSTYYPDSFLHATLVPSEGNPNPSDRFGRNDYYSNLQKCRVVLTLRGAGYDTFRFWENAACNAVHISQKIPIIVPNDFVTGRHILRFSDPAELRRLTNSILENGAQFENIIVEGRNHLMNYHLTTKRALYLLDRLKMVF